MINSKAMMLSTLVDDLSHVSDLSSQTMEYKFYERNAAELFDDLITQAEIHINSSRHKALIRTEINPDAVVIVDPYRIQQVITNLINNAILKSAMPFPCHASQYLPPLQEISMTSFTISLTVSWCSP